MDFLPEDYDDKVLEKESRYMKFQEGDNKFRILSSPILGHEGWKDNKPVRWHLAENHPNIEWDDGRLPKHFWAMVVWNYQEKKIQILELTQKSIMRAIKTLAQDEDWGQPFEYDIVVNKTGQKLDTVYQTQPKPKKPVEVKIAQAYTQEEIDLEKLFTGEDPFLSHIEAEVEETDPEKEDLTEDVDPKDIPF